MYNNEALSHEAPHFLSRVPTEARHTGNWGWLQKNLGAIISLSSRTSELRVCG